jgi:arylformamidase
MSGTTADAGIDWEDAFVNAGRIDGGEGFPDLWSSRAAAFRAEATADLNIPYGEHARQVFDLFHPQGAPRGLAVIVHGGYWLSFDKSFWSDLAEGALANGWAVAMPSYRLAPEVRVSKVVADVAQAITVAADRIAGPVRLAGHSAGGHLVTRMVTDTSPLKEPVANRVERVVSISGLHDLRPVRLNTMNESLRLDPQEALAESPALRERRGQVDVTAWVGARERPEFLRQAALLAEAWDIPLVADPGRHHFDVIDGLKDPHHPLCKAFVGA